MVFSSAAMGSTYSLTLGQPNESGWYLHGTITTAPATGIYLGAESVISSKVFAENNILNGKTYDFGLIPGGPSQNNDASAYTSLNVQYDNLLFHDKKAGPGFDPNGSGVAGDSVLDAYGIFFDGYKVSSKLQVYYLSLYGSKTTPGGYGMTLWNYSGGIVDSQDYAPPTGVGSGDPPMTLTVIPEIDPGSFASTVALLLGLMGVLEHRCRPMPLLARGPLSRPHS